MVRELERPGVDLLALWEEHRVVYRVTAGSASCSTSSSGGRRNHTPAARGRTQGVRRLFRQADADHRSGRGRGEHGGDLRRRAGCVQPDLCEATWTQKLPNLIGAHVRMFRFWGAPPRLLVPDNLKSAIHKASFYDPEVNCSCGAMATHYGMGILPARPKRRAIRSPLRRAYVSRRPTYPRPAAQCDVLLLGRVQHRHRCFGETDKQPRDAPAPDEPPPTVQAIGYHVDLPASSPRPHPAAWG